MNLKNKLFKYFSIHLKTCKKSWDYRYIHFKDNWDLFEIYIQNPFRTWWKARKYFKIPKTKIKFFYKQNQMHFTDCVINNYGKLFGIDISDLMWKDKWSTPRFEFSPHIFFCLFNRFGFCIYPKINQINEFGEKVNGNLEYWEYLLDYIYYNKTLRLTSSWTTPSKIFYKIKEYGKSEDGSDDIKESCYIPILTHLFSLNKKGLKEFKKLYQKEKNN